MHLYVMPGACSLASHIALETVAERAAFRPAGFEVTVIQRGRNHDPAYATVNPLGTVPALVTSSGQLILESLAVLLHIADAFPQARLAPPASPDRDRLHVLLSVMVTAGHGAFQMLWRPERFADTDDGRGAVQRMCERRIEVLFKRLEQEIGSSGYLLGDEATVIDMYLYVLGRWGLRLGRPTSLYPDLWRFTQRMADLEPVRRAMFREAIALQGPASGLG